MTNQKSRDFLKRDASPLISFLLSIIQISFDNNIYQTEKGDVTRVSSEILEKDTISKNHSVIQYFRSPKSALSPDESLVFNFFNKILFGKFEALLDYKDRRSLTLGAPNYALTFTERTVSYFSYDEILKMLIVSKKAFDFDISKIESEKDYIDSFFNSQYFLECLQASNEIEKACFDSITMAKFFRSRKKTKTRPFDKENEVSKYLNLQTYFKEFKKAEFIEACFCSQSPEVSSKKPFTIIEKFLEFESRGVGNKLAYNINYYIQKKLSKLQGKDFLSKKNYISESLHYNNNAIVMQTVLPGIKYKETGFLEILFEHVLINSIEGKKDELLGTSKKNKNDYTNSYRQLLSEFSIFIRSYRVDPKSGTSVSILQLERKIHQNEKLNLVLEQTKQLFNATIDNFKILSVFTVESQILPDMLNQLKTNLGGFKIRLAFLKYILARGINEVNQNYLAEKSFEDLHSVFESLKGSLDSDLKSFFITLEKGKFSESKPTNLKKYFGNFMEEKPQWLKYKDYDEKWKAGLGFEPIKARIDHTFSDFNSDSMQKNYPVLQEEDGPDSAVDMPHKKRQLSKKAGKLLTRAKHTILDHR